MVDCPDCKIARSVVCPCDTSTANAIGNIDRWPAPEGYCRPKKLQPVPNSVGLAPLSTKTYELADDAAKLDDAVMFVNAVGLQDFGAKEPGSRSSSRKNGCCNRSWMKSWRYRSESCSRCKSPRDSNHKPGVKTTLWMMASSSTSSTIGWAAGAAMMNSDWSAQYCRSAAARCLRFDHARARVLH